MLMRIGELSKRSGTPVRTIRFYEDRGVIPPPDRTESGYRDYDEQAVNRLHFVSAAQGAGLSLAEISSILAVRDEGRAPCAHTTQLLEAKRAEIDARLSELRRIRKEIDGLLVRSQSLNPSDCDPDKVCQVIAG